MRLLFLAVFMGLMGLARPAQAHECNKVIATAHPEYPPYHWKANGKIIGASVALTKKIFDELGIEFEARYEGPWKRVLSSAKAGRFDMVLALKKTQERALFLEFTTKPIAPNPFAVFMKANSAFEYDEWADLINKKGGKNAGDRYGGSFDSFAQKFLTLEDGFSTESNLKKLLSGRTEYFIHGRYVGLAHFSTLKNGDQVKPLEVNINDGVIHSGFTKGSPCKVFLPYVSRRYGEMLQSGEAQRTLLEYVDRWAEFAKSEQKN
ncbi:substrate-binding periplasmic protein [Candidatus Terasakiella magnetica]|nr:transporter substrate-binding domain-containing protein [Candidatus Terasakiella magnetica]